ncbi:MAG: N-acetylmuramoyl-L-alanine amidase [Acidimicrobiia bacterium]
MGVVSPTGVPLAILEIGTDGYTVLTPCGNTTEVLGGDPIHDVRVVLDPGHGGPIDTGAVAPTGMPEKDLNLRVARSARHLLEERGISTVLTRTFDYAVPLGVRAQFADRLGANVMVSIHHNAPTPNPSAQPGVEVFVQSRSLESRRLGGILWEESMDSLSDFDVQWSSAPDAGVMTVLNTRGSDAYGIIRGPQTPTALIELGYISNRAEAELYQTPQYVPTAAQSVADAIERYLITDDGGSGFVESRTFNPQPGVGRDVCVEPDLG